MEPGVQATSRRWAVRAAQRRASAESSNAPNARGEEAGNQLGSPLGGEELLPCRAVSPAATGKVMAVPSSSEGNLVEQELELLRAVWPDEAELHVEHPMGLLARLVVQLAPRTAGDHHEQFVRCELVLEVPLSYPAAQVQVVLGSCRGLAEEQVAALLQTLTVKAESLLGEETLFMLVEAAQEALTALNIPVGDCAICLRELGEMAGAPGPDMLGASSDSALARTPCFHTFHSSCLANFWWAEWERQAAARSEPQYSIGFGRVSDASVLCPECRGTLPWAEMPQLHGLLERRAAKVPSVPEVNAAPQGTDSECDVPLTPVESADGAAPAVADAARDVTSPAGDTPGVREVTLFEVVHHCGTCYRTAPRWNSKLDKGQVRKGFTGVVAETVEGDTAYIRPEGSKYWLPVKGLSASVKILHLEKTREVAAASEHDQRLLKVSRAEDPAVIAAQSAVSSDARSGDVLVAFRCKPNARVTQAMGFKDGQVDVQLAAPPRDGEANAELLAFAATALSMRKGDVSLHSGYKDRRKLVRLAGMTVHDVVERLVAHMSHPS